MTLKKKNTQHNLNRIIVTEDTTGAETECYNRLRDNIMFLNAAQHVKVLQIESAVSGEGKTTVSCHLAVSLGFAGKKVVLVELDFRHPTAHRLFNAEGENGIQEYIIGDIQKERVAKKTEYKNVDIVTRGGEITNPSVVFISSKFKALINYLRESYDFVILDCAPILAVSDYINISKVADGTLLLVAHSATPKQVVATAVEELRKNDIKLLGTAFTMYNSKKGDHYGYRHKYYYGNNASSDKNKIK